MSTLHSKPRTNWTCISVRIYTPGGELQYEFDWEPYLEVREELKSFIAYFRKVEMAEAYIFVTLRYGPWDQDKFQWTYAEGWQ